MLWAFWVAAISMSSQSWAQTGEDAAREDARRIGYAGIEAYQRGDYAAAEEQLSRAYHLLPAPSLGLWSARALAKAGKLVEAVARYEEVAGLPVTTGEAEVQRQAQTEATVEHSSLLSSIPRLELRLEGADWKEVVIFIDGRPLQGDGARQPILLNPGKHAVSGRRGEQVVQINAVLSDGEREPATLIFSRPPEAPPGAARTVSVRPFAYAAWGVAALGFGTFAILAPLAKADEKAFQQNCPSATNEPESVAPGVCLEGTVDKEKSAYERKGIWSDIGLLTGLTGAVTGTALWLLGSSDATTARAERMAAGLSLGGLGLAGLTSAALLAHSSSTKHDELSACEPCTVAQVDAADARTTWALVSLGVGTLALGGATWALLGGSSDEVEPSQALDVSFSGGRSSTKLLISGTF